jgi:hypothetical protein
MFNNLTECKSRGETAVEVSTNVSIPQMNPVRQKFIDFLSSLTLLQLSVRARFSVIDCSRTADFVALLETCLSE